MKTIPIEIMTKEARRTGLIGENAAKALAHCELIADEKELQLRTLYAENVISEKQLKQGIDSIKKELQFRIAELGFEDI